MVLGKAQCVEVGTIATIPPRRSHDTFLYCIFTNKIKTFSVSVVTIGFDTGGRLGYWSPILHQNHGLQGTLLCYNISNL